MSFSFSDFAEALKAGAEISADDVLAVRRWAWDDGSISAAEAEAIFELNDLATKPSAEWVDFFVEALTDFIVHQPPEGYVDEAKVDWLIARIESDGRIETLGELELLAKIMDHALNTPASLKAFVLGEIENTITSGEGPTRRDGALRPGVIDSADVALLRRILFAAGGEAGVTVSRNEAELLWRLKEATTGADNAPEWKTLFVQAVGNYLMAHNFYHPLERADAERLESFINDHHSNVAGFLGRMLKSVPSAHVSDAIEPRQESHLEQDIADDQAITGDEKAWLSAHLDHDGPRDPLEQALVDFIAEESGTRF
jgi:hypothetical protein